MPENQGYHIFCVIDFSSKYLPKKPNPDRNSAVRNINQILMDNARKTKLQFLFSRKTSVEVDSYLNNYHKDPNLFTSTGTAKNTKSINFEDQIQEKVFTFLSLNNIGYVDEGEKEVLKSIAYGICQLCQYTNKYRERLSHNSVTLFEWCPLLSSTKDCVITGRNISRNNFPHIIIEDLNTKMDLCLSIKSKFPSRFSNKKDNRCSICRSTL